MSDIALWLDDKRPKPWWATHAVVDAQSAITLLQTGLVTRISLDHDLGDEEVVGSGYLVARWIEEAAYAAAIPRLEWAVHSQNPVGAQRMRCALENADRLWSRHAS